MHFSVLWPLNYSRAKACGQAVEINKLQNLYNGLFAIFFGLVGGKLGNTGKQAD